MNQHLVPKELLELAFRALDDARCEIEALERSEEWFTASPKMMKRIEQAMARLEEAMK